MLRFLMALILLMTTLFVSPLYADDSFVNRPDVQAFIQKMVKKHHFTQAQLDVLFSQVKIHPQVMVHINKPLEKETWHTYQMLFVNPWRIEHGVEFWDKYASALQKAEQTYGVPASIIVATIGIETRYGEKIGEYRVIDSLSNIAFSNSPRALYFRGQLEEFLLLTREQQLDPLKVMGSYAGAMGQPQFMPSSYRYYAVNFSKSGKIDLMHDSVDAIGSVANYYHQYGWKLSEPVAIEAVTIGNNYDYLTHNYKMPQALTLSQWDKYGIVPKETITPNTFKAKVIELQSHLNKEYWLGFHNFDVIKRYNASDLYAMAVYQLSNYIKALRERIQ